MTQTACTQPAGYVAVAGDGCPTDPNKTSAGTCGCGTADTDTDGDGTPDCNDTDDDNDGVLDGVDTAPLDPDVCADADGDGCDDCSIGTDGFGPLADNTPNNDGTDFDGDGLCDSGDPDDDNDGALDGNDSDDNDANVCSDTDGDGCDDCSGGSYDPANDGTDTDGDGLCNSGDTDDDGDGVADGSDSAPLNPNVCSDTDGDGCDDCSNGSYDPSNDGTDTDGDGTCDSGDGCPNDPNKTAPGICGCGSIDVDANSNGICDSEECIDSADPVAVAQNLTVYLDPTGNVSITASQVDNGSSDDCAVASLALDNMAFDCADIGTPVTVTLTVTDGSGNTDTATATITVLDNTAPGSLSASGTTLNLSSGSVTLSPSDVSASATDNCTSAPIYELSGDNSNWSSSLVFDCSDQGANTVYVRALDAVSNASASTSVSVTVANAAPTISDVTSGITEVLSGSGSATIDASDYLTASDDCTASGSLTYEISETAGSGFATTFTADCGDLGAKTFYFRVTDASGIASAESSVSITIADQANPVIASVTGGTISLDANGAATITASSTYVTATDNCTASGSLTYLVSKTVGGTFASTLSIDCDDLGGLDIYFKVQDGTGNTSSVSSSASFTIVDNIGPTTTASAGSVNLDAVGAATVSISDFSASATDNCSASPSIELSKDESTWASTLDYGCSDIGTTTVYLRSSDGTQYGPTISVDLTLADATAPVIGSTTTSASLITSGYTIDPLTVVTVTENCTPSGSLVAQVSLTNGSGYVDDLTLGCSDLGTTTLYFRFEDASGNESTTSFDFTLTDGTSLAASANNVVLGLVSGTATLQATNSSFNTSTDNCAFTSEVKLTSETDATFASSLDFTSAGPYSVTLRITDSDGVTQTAIATVTVVGDPISSTIYFEDFEDETSSTSFCSSPYTSADGQWTYTCPSVGNLYVYPLPSGGTGDGFNWYQNQDAGVWLSSSIDISSYLYVDISTLIFDNNRLENGEGIQLYAIVDGVESLVDSDTDGFITEGDSLTASGLSGSTLQVKITSTCYSSQTQASKVEETWVDNIRVRGYCVDADMNGICDNEQTCVDVPAGSCGCLDKTACTYSASATINDPDRCVYAGGQCQDPVGSQYYFYDLTCSCTAETFTSLYFEDFGLNGASGGPGTGYGYLGSTDVNGASAETEWTLSFDGANIADGNTGNGVGPGYWRTTGATTEGVVTDTIFDGMNLGLEARWTTKSIDVSSYAWARFQALISEDGTMEADDYIKVQLIEDGTELFTALDSIADDMPDPDWPTYQTTDVVRANGASNIQLQISAINNDCLPCPGDDEYHTFDDVEVLGWGVRGCTDPGSPDYSSAAEVDDATCTFTAMAYSRYDGAFTDKLWQGTACGAGGCGSAPFPLARSVDAASQDASTTQNYTISSGTSLTVDGTSVASDDPNITELFVRDLTIESGGTIVIPAGKRLRVMGTFIDNDGNAVSGDGMLCIDGTFTIGTGEGSPATVNVQDFELPPSATLTVPENKTLAVNGNLAFGPTNPLAVSGLVSLSGSSAQTISGDGATLDELEISNSSGVTVNDSLEIQGRLKLTSGELDLGDNILVFASKSESGSEEKTAVLDKIPSGASLTGTLSSGGRMAQSMSGADANVVVERYISADGDGVTYTGYTLFGSPIDGAVVGDLDGIDGFYLAGWPGTSWPNSFSSILFWDEANSAFVEPASNNTPLDTLGGAWIVIAGSQTPTMSTAGALNSHVEGDSKTFALTRTDNTTVAEFKGWNLIYNPYQARLDWHQVLDNSGNAALVEDQYAVYDTQAQQFVRYSETNTSLTSASRYIEPGQSFWVRLPSTKTNGTFTLTPDMIDNDAAGAEFVRSAAEGEVSVLLETRNAYGATQSLLRFSDNGDAEAYLDGDLSRLGSSSVKSGELAFLSNGQQYVAKTLPQDVDGEFYVRSRANFETTIRVLEVTGDVSFCGHIEDGETGAVMLLQEGEELVFTLPAHEAEAGRFTMHGERFAEATGLAPDCPDSQAGMIVVELGEVVADLTVVNYETMEQVGLALQATGTIEFPMSPGEYSIVVEATEETSLCRGGRRQVVVAPGEQPELLDVIPVPSPCNEGAASLAFELYGSGEFYTSLMQGSVAVWEGALPSGEQLISGFEPGDYVLKVDHSCLQTFQVVSLWDEAASDVAVDFNGFVEAESTGGGWIEANCMGCATGEGFGYRWMVNGELVQENEPLSFRLEQNGWHMAELMAYSPVCSQAIPFEFFVGKTAELGQADLNWLGAQQGELGMVFPEEWSGVSVKGFDSSGRLIHEESIGDVVGEVFVALPKALGWTTIEVRSSDGKVARWTGVF